MLGSLRGVFGLGDLRGDLRRLGRRGNPLFKKELAPAKLSEPTTTRANAIRKDIILLRAKLILLTSSYITCSILRKRI
jgi:hypothetical protein